MANQINNRIFGGDIPIRVKKTLEARQFLSHKNRKPGDEINPSAYTDPDKSSYKFNSSNQSRFRSAIRDFERSQEKFGDMMQKVISNADILIAR